MNLCDLKPLNPLYCFSVRCRQGYVYIHTFKSHLLDLQLDLSYIFLDGFKEWFKSGFIRETNIFGLPTPGVYF